MSSHLHAVPMSPGAPAGTASAAPSPLHSLYWSVRRELWEHRSIQLAPLGVAAFALLGFMISLVTFPGRIRALPTLTLAERHDVVTTPYSAVAAALILTAFVVGVFYCLDALHGERRDRSILFWKSLPVSDGMTVLSKAAIPLVVLPALAFATAAVVQLMMLALSLAVLLASGIGIAPWWSELRFFTSLVAVLYAVLAITLWHAPIYGWLLLVSVWARRAALVWAVLPPLAIAALERLAFGTTRVQELLEYLLIGWLRRAFFVPEGSAGTDHLALITPERLLSTPGLWIGFAITVAFLAAAVRLRRYREPI